MILHRRRVYARIVKRRSRVLQRLFLFFAAIIVIVATLYLVVLPLYATAQIHAILKDAGLKDATFKLDRISLTGVDLTKVEVGRPQWLGGVSVRVKYSVSSQWNSRLKSIDISGARWTVRASDHGIDWGYEKPPSGLGSKLNDLPVDVVNIRDSTVSLDVDGEGRDILVSGALTRAAPGKFAVSLQAATLQADGQFDLTGESPQGVLAAKVPAIDLADLKVLRGFFPALREADIGGTGTADSTLRFANGRFESDARITFDHLKMSNPNWVGSVDDASGTVVFDDLSALSTPPHQQITIAKATLGPTHISDAQITFSVARPDSIDIEHASWSMGDLGQFAASPFAFNPRDPQLKTELECRNVGLGPWLDLLTSGRADAQGTLDGRVQLNYQASKRNPVSVTAGDLHSTSANGWIRTGDAETLEEMLKQSVVDSSMGGQWDQIKDRIVRALQDFQYSTFDVSLQPEGDHVVCKISTAGKGRRGPDAQEIGGLTVNIRPFDEILNQALGIKSALERRE